MIQLAPQTWPDSLEKTPCVELTTKSGTDAFKANNVIIIDRGIIVIIESFLIGIKKLNLTIKVLLLNRRQTLPHCLPATKLRNLLEHQFQRLVLLKPINGLQKNHLHQISTEWNALMQYITVPIAQYACPKVMMMSDPTVVQTKIKTNFQIEEIISKLPSALKNVPA